MSSGTISNIQAAIFKKIIGVEMSGDMDDLTVLQAIRDKLRGVTRIPFGSLRRGIYLQQIRDAYKGIMTNTGKYGDLEDAIYLQQIVNAKNGVADKPFGSLDETVYWQKWLDAL